MRATRSAGAAVLFGLLTLLHSAIALAAPTRTELAGNPLAEFPFFEYVKAFNVNAPINVAIDPTRFPSVVGKTCDVYIVNAKSSSQWAANASLVDVTAGGKQTQSFGGATIQANTFQVAAPSELSANAGTGLGVGYDAILDCDQNGQLGDADFIDGGAGEAGLYVVHDTTVAGPLAVTESVYNLDAGVGAMFGIPATHLGEDLYFPTNIATMGKRPLVVVGHGNGHNFQWYDHIGNHLASYGYVVVSIANNTGPGPNSAADTTLGHTDAFLDQAEAGAIAGGALVGHVDANNIVWIGHSRGAEAVAISYDRLFDGTVTPTHYVRKSIRLISSMLPTDFEGTDVANPHDANYHLWTAAGDDDVNGSAGDECSDGMGNFFELCQTFHLHERATGYRQSTVVQGTGHGWFHDNNMAGAAFTGPCAIGPPNATTHLIQLGYLLPLVKHYVEGNIPALDFLTRQYERFHPIGVPSGNPCIVVTNEYRNGSAFGNFVIDDYQTQTGTGTSSSGSTVTFDVENLTEGRLDDNNHDFSWSAADPFNGATQAGATDGLTVRNDTSRGVVFDWTNADRFYEWQVPTGARNFSSFLFLSFRAAQGTQHPNTLAAPGDLNFTVTLRDGSGATSSIRIGAYGGGLEQPYARSGGWHNEMETIRIRTTDFLNNGSSLNLSDVAAVRLNVGPSFGSGRGRIVVDDLMLTSNVTPFSLQIIEPTTARPSYAGSSEAGSRVLVRVFAGGGLDVSPGNLTISVAGVALTPAQIPTAAAQVGGETWIIIAPGAKAPGCYDLAVALTTPSGVAAAQPQSLCYNDDETRAFDRVLAVDQTNSMNYDGSTGTSNGAKMEAARAAAKFFVDLSNPADQIGVISFQRRDQDGNGTIVDPDELAEVKFTLTTAGEGATDQRPAARTAIGAIAPDTSPGFTGPETSPGAGLLEARTMLNAGGIAGHEPNIVMLTDGLENYAPFWSKAGPSGSPLKPSFEAGPVRVDTVGVGGDADDALLIDIASATGGEFRNLTEGSGSFFLLSRLSNWYKAVDEDVRGEQRFFYMEGFPPLTAVGGGTLASSRARIRIQRFTVEANLDWMTVAFHANIDNAATVALFEPGSTVPIVVAPPNVTLRTDPKHSVYRIRHPKPGVWAYVVQANDLSAEFFAVASGPTSLSARMGPNQLQRSGAGFAMPLRVWIADGKAVLNATVTGYVRHPSGVKVPVTLVDDGAHADGAANDAIYGLTQIVSQPGAYWVELKATGTSTTGNPFERYLSNSFVVPGQRKRPQQYGEGLPQPPRFCRCASESRYSVALFGGATFPMGTFGTIAGSSSSIGVKPAVHFPAPGGTWSAGLYIGRDNFTNASGGTGYRLIHVSPEIEFTPALRVCPAPSMHLGIGSYRDENGNTKGGYNIGGSARFCLTERLNLLARYDRRSVSGLSRDYSTVQVGVRFRF